MKAGALLACALLAGALGSGCAGTRPRGPARPVTLPERPVVAVLPFEDLSGRADVAEAFTRVFLAELVRSGTAEVVEPGLVEAAVERLRIRTTVAMTGSEMKMLSDSLGATHLLFGNVLESGTVRTSDGDVPAVAATLRLVRADSGTVVWACHHARTGEDHETIFGWGRERSRDRLLSALAQEMIGELRRSAVHQAAPETRRSGP